MHGKFSEQLQLISFLEKMLEKSVSCTSSNIEFIPHDNVNEIVDKLFESLLSRYQNNLETSMR